MCHESAHEDDEHGFGQFASPPCFMHELDPSFVAGPVDPRRVVELADRHLGALPRGQPSTDVPAPPCIQSAGLFG